MKHKLLYILLLSSIIVCARENPFVVLNSQEDIGQATIKKDTREFFSTLSTNLPNTARILKSVEFHYQNLDGSLESKNITIDKKIDWHDELILKNSHNNDNDEVQIATVPLVAKPLQKDEAITTDIVFKNIVSFSIKGKDLLVRTPDAKLRDFLVSNPYKIVLDFKKEISFYTKVFELETKGFKNITIGKHAGYYRVVIELDGQYQYDIKKVSDGFLITLI